MKHKNWILYEDFADKSLNENLEWRCEPKKWFIDTKSSQLVLETDQETDYWQKTHYGFEVDNGHFLFTKTNKNFRMTTRVKAIPKSKYDQAGLMIRFSEEVWVKTSLEYIPDGLSKLGAVVTNKGYSDWSTQYVDCEEVQIYYRISKIGQNCYVDFSWDGEVWNQIRIAHLDVAENSTILAGVYACSPQGREQEVRFDFITIEELNNDPATAYL
ncbi:MULTISPECIES: DUF1349 domain-containing protein [Niallia]|uniref:DUF1349 domain-containing protein n=1 Tax=Niallia TaxID=2837506 RepID=UPI00031A8CBF|nr:DUF1349 domain-containing protein [Niallia circulans]AYV66145.1 DUF1349 domain-containing protein [Niallia circulans]AYV71040.1 DUF1349 domain-containing protein [Niallia circulans]NRG28943.1 DUF1349 domain-containing protein [Niallia circulans]QJX62031.1 DUF1349 domain-containing protein [Niallia circulans]